jgi:type VI protein secretion system component VasF
MTTVTPQQTEHAQRRKTTGPTDAAWMIALLLVFAVAVGYFFVNVIQFHLLPH